jgi:hypothetical protein
MHGMHNTAYDTSIVASLKLESYQLFDVPHPFCMHGMHDTAYDTSIVASLKLKKKLFSSVLFNSVSH